MAAAAISVAHRHGLHVPDDLSVAGFDDTPDFLHRVADHHHGSSTDFRDGAGRRTRLPAQEYFHCTLIERKSSAPPRPAQARRRRPKPHEPARPNARQSMPDNSFRLTTQRLTTALPRFGHIMVIHFA
ncbi:MAG TPA: substrate-binding domain-containing protein [Steroidobacteraceae bacterium]